MFFPLKIVNQGNNMMLVCSLWSSEDEDQTCFFFFPQELSTESTATLLFNLAKKHAFETNFLTVPTFTGQSSLTVPKLSSFQKKPKLRVNDENTGMALQLEGPYYSQPDVNSVEKRTVRNSGTQ